MAETVHKLHGDPNPCDRRCRCPTTSHGPPVTTDPERNHDQVDCHEATLEVRGNQTADESRRRKRLKELEDVLLYRVERLNDNQGEECVLGLHLGYPWSPILSVAVPSLSSIIVP